MDLYDELDRIAPSLNNLKKSSNAKYEYLGVADAIVWCDERPPEPLCDELAFRYLLKYRTSMICGEPIAAIEPYWNYAKDAFPDWPGFLPERCGPSENLANCISKMRLEMEDFFDSEA